MENCMKNIPEIPKVAQVLVVPTEKISWLDAFKHGWYDGGKDCDKEKIIEVLLQDAMFMDRTDAETNPDFKQLIPYCVLQKPTSLKYFVYQRTPKSGEKRLHHLFSCGLGGHLNPIDGESNLFETYWTGMRRELTEEVGLKQHAGTTLGFIYDNSNEVGKVHIGICHLIYPLQKALFEPKVENTMRNWAWETLDTMKKNIDMFEGWSKILINSGVLL